MFSWNLQIKGPSKSTSRTLHHLPRLKISTHSGGACLISRRLYTVCIHTIFRWEVTAKKKWGWSSILSASFGTSVNRHRWHYDVKPDNILVFGQQGKGPRYNCRFKLTDFGLSMFEMTNGKSTNPVAIEGGGTITYGMSAIQGRYPAPLYTSLILTLMHRSPRNFQTRSRLGRYSYSYLSKR